VVVVAVEVVDPHLGVVAVPAEAVVVLVTAHLLTGILHTVTVATDTAVV